MQEAATAPAESCKCASALGAPGTSQAAPQAAGQGHGATRLPAGAPSWLQLAGRAQVGADHVRSGGATTRQISGVHRVFGSRSHRPQQRCSERRDVASWPWRTGGRTGSGSAAAAAPGSSARRSPSCRASSGTQRLVRPRCLQGAPAASCAESPVLARAGLIDFQLTPLLVDQWRCAASRRARPAHARSTHAHDRPAAQAEAGQRAAVLGDGPRGSGAGWQCGD